MSEFSHSEAQALNETKQLSLFAAITSLGYVFWIVGGMEMVERLAFYGVRTVSGLYVTEPKSQGGLGVSAEDLGIIFLIWAMVQSIVPALVGGLADRMGYKETIFLSTVVKIAAYLVMGFFPNYWGFVVGAVILAIGTGIFKPGLQGTLAKVCNRQNSSMAWGIFYQTVNIGAWMGPLVAAQLRQLAWSHLFFACALIISVNFLLLLLYREPDKEERLARRMDVAKGKIKEPSLWRESIAELKKPHLASFLLIMCGFWFMFNSLFDVLPLYIRDWVDTSLIVRDLFGENGTPNPVPIFLLGMNREGTHIMPEGLLNVNAGMIMISCFLFAQLSSKFKAVNSMILGSLCCGIAFAVIGYTNAAWIALFGIMIFSAGEMLSSPKFLEYIGNFAPNDKKAMYLGFSNLPIAVGWMAESYIAPTLYGKYSAKETLSREMLLSLGENSKSISDIPQGEAFIYLVSHTGQEAEVLTQVLYQNNSVGSIWLLMSTVAVLTVIGLFVYGKWITRLMRH